MRTKAWLSWAVTGSMIVSIAVSLTAPAEAQTQPSDAFAARLDAEVPGLLEKYGVPGSVISYIDDGAVAWTRAYGLADVSTGTAMSSDMVFEFGSCGKVITAWAAMLLVERGLIDLDAPVNSYLKRWQIESDEFDTDQVTVRRLLTHTSGLNIHGYLDFSPRRVNPPDLLETLRGVRMAEGVMESSDWGYLSLGNVELVQEPGSGQRYSGGGYGVLQMVIEDVTGSSFDEFIQNEVTDPLGATSVRWAWTPDLVAQAPTPYGDEGQELEHRQLTMHGIGSEIATVPDFARFVAAAVAGPNGEPPGRAVLQPETISLMTSPWWEAGSFQGMGYALASLDGNPAVTHGGSNTGWEAFFLLDIETREGFVVATASSRAAPFLSTITDFWFDASYLPNPRTDWPPLPQIGEMSRMYIAISSVLVLMLGIGVFRFVRSVRAGKRTRVRRPTRRGVVMSLPWVAALLFGWYTVYSSLPLYLPGWFPDVYPTTGSLILTMTLIAWLNFALIKALFPRQSPVTVDGSDVAPTARPVAGSGDPALGGLEKSSSRPDIQIGTTHPTARREG
jgi:CubicO group peptidase (beta-lactamase class C family)